MTRTIRSAGRRGISMVVVVILVVVTVILVMTSVVLYAQWADRERAHKMLNEQISSQTAIRDNRAAEIRRQLPPTGLIKPETDIKELNEQMSKAELDKRIQALVPVYASGDAAARDEVKAREAARIYPTLQSIVDLAAVRMLQQHNRLRNLQMELEIAKGHAEVREKSRPEMVKSKEAYVAELNEKIAKVNQLIANENTQYNERKALLTAQRDEAVAATEQQESSHKKWLNRMRGELSVLASELEELKAKESIRYEIAVSHGHILSPDIPNRSAFIDIGSRDRVVPGLKFMVAKRGDQGRFVYKALVEVKKVWMTYAEVAINTVLDDEVPVIDGDVIVNPLFHKRRPVVVAFAGEERPVRIKPAWSVDEASRRIREIGSEVVKEPGLNVDFVIWTEGKITGTATSIPTSYPAYKLATLLEIPIADATEIFRFMGD